MKVIRLTGGTIRLVEKHMKTKPKTKGRNENKRTDRVRSVHKSHRREVARHGRQTAKVGRRRPADKGSVGRGSYGCPFRVGQYIIHNITGMLAVVREVNKGVVKAEPVEKEYTIFPPWIQWSHLILKPQRR